MTGRRFMRSLLTVLLMSVVGLGGWSMPVPARAQNAGDAAPMVTPEDLADVSVFYEPLAPYGTGTSLPACGQMDPETAPGYAPTSGRTSGRSADNV